MCPRGGGRLDDDWITVNGTHVLVDDDGNAKSGGKLKGKNFSKAKSQKRTTSSKVGTSGGKYAKLSDSVSKIRDSDMSKKEKGEAYKQMVKDAEPGTTFKINGMEFRKSDDPDYPIDAIDFEGKTINSYRDMDFDLEYYADKENCLTFFDKEAEIAERKKAAASMKKSGDFSTSDSVHGERPGKITEASSNFGEEGDYVVYRNGSIGSNGMIFFSPKKETADTYASLHDSGNTGEYEVHLQNPLVINGTTDVDCIRQAYEKLHPGKTLKGPLTSSKWISSDKANASALNSGVGGYDSIVYVLNGEPHEVQVSAKKAKRDVTKTGEYTTTQWSRTGHTYEEAALRGMISEGAEDYKRVDSNTDGFGDDGVHCSFEHYDAILKSFDSFGNESRADTDWITVNGAHIPLDDDGTALGGGKLKGKNFSKARSEKKSKKKSIPKQPAKCKNRISKAQQDRYEKSPEGQKMLMNMSPEEVNEFVFSAETTDPDYGSVNEKQALQCVLDKLGMNDKPKVVSKDEFSEEEWNSPVGTMYRGVEANAKLGMSAEDVVKNTLYGEETIVGYGVEASGIYFAPDEKDVQLYAGKGKGKIMKACFSEDTRLVDYEKLMDLQAKSGIEDMAVCALYHGYNAIIADYGSGEEYLIALDRSSLVFEEPDE